MHTVCKYSDEARPIYFEKFRMESVKSVPLRTIRLKVNETGEVFSDEMRAFMLELPEFRNLYVDKTYMMYNLVGRYKYVFKVKISPVVRSSLRIDLKDRTLA